jgi:hypothetical protein
MKLCHLLTIIVLLQFINCHLDMRLYEYCTFCLCWECRVYNQVQLLGNANRRFIGLALKLLRDWIENMGRDLIFGCMVKLTDCSSHKLLGIFELTMLYKLLSFSITLSSLLKFRHLSYSLLSALSFLMPGYACAC